MTDKERLQAFAERIEQDTDELIMRADLLKRLNEGKEVKDAEAKTDTAAG